MHVRRAKTADVGPIRDLVDHYRGDGRLLHKPTVTLYEDIQDFRVAVDGDRVIGCGALHVLWRDLGEIRTLGVSPEARGSGAGHALLELLIADARDLGLERLFCLTFETAFFGRHGFVEIEGTPVEPEVYGELRLSYDEGVAEFLDLERVKPNILGNTRMLLDLR
jgi:amino-acid N-acetyltransferase